jgi:electron transfer flavoprotein beta subunit
VRITVLVKSMPEPGMPLRQGLDTLPEPEDLAWVMNPADLAACGVVSSLRAFAGELTTTAVTFGPERAEAALRVALACGADRAVRVPSQGDGIATSAFTTAAALAALVEPEPPDLLLAGAQANSRHGGQVAATVAALLGWPLVSHVVSVSAADPPTSLRVERLVSPRRREVLEVSLPAVLAVATEAGIPEEPSLPDWIAAHAAEVEIVTPRARRSTLPEPRLVAVGAPRPRPKRIFTPSSDLPAEERMRLLLLGGVKQRQGQLVDGTPEAVAERLVSFLLEQGLAGDDA